ncbi:hypothetical protein BDV96DRAFT_100918 [Lophiotrema nucula]|uniref:Uncharacterized protein n=1 Tax=Lophiotrema nucula TaxID=690887 RepID=A0A6A5Z542_9PLEO|nr:hypothetical protein BDV96DRAFT_100918 [Lophiotrema nucula]
MRVVIEIDWGLSLQRLKKLFERDEIIRRTWPSADQRTHRYFCTFGLLPTGRTRDYKQRAPLPAGTRPLSCCCCNRLSLYIGPTSHICPGCAGAIAGSIPWQRWRERLCDSKPKCGQPVRDHQPLVGRRWPRINCLHFEWLDWCMGRQPVRAASEGRKGERLTAQGRLGSPRIDQYETGLAAGADRCPTQCAEHLNMRVELQTKAAEERRGKAARRYQDAMEQQISKSGVSLNTRTALLAPANADAHSFPRPVAHTGQITLFVVWRCDGYPS